MKIFWVILMYAAVLFLQAGCWPDRSETELFPEEQADELGSFITRLQQALPLPGIAVAVIKDRAVYYHTAGYRRLADEAPFTDSTVFFSGNLSELMVASTVLRLAGSGKISLDDPVVLHLPYFRLAGDTYRTITVRHLLTHTSGVPYHEATWELPSAEAALEATTRSIRLQEPVFDPPGSRIKRSPYNYDILADLVSKVSGTSFEAYARDEVFRPLGMHASSFTKGTVPEDQLARPHEIGNWLNYTISDTESYPYNPEHAGSIGFHTSVRDIAGWMYMLLQGRRVAGADFLNKDLHREMMKAHYKTGENAYTGFAWEIRGPAGQYIYKKSHQTGGFSADMTLIPAQNTGVLVVSNIGGDFNPGFISGQIIAWLNGHDLNLPKTPVSVAMGEKLDATGSLDSAFRWYAYLKEKHPAAYDFSEEVLSQLGVNLLYRLEDPEKAILVFRFCTKEFPASASAYLHLAEACFLHHDNRQASQALDRAKRLAVSGGHADLHARLAYMEEALALEN